MEQKSIIRKLLEIELQNFAFRLGLVNHEPQELQEHDCISALVALQEISQSDDEYSRQLSIMIVALVWTYAPEAIQDGVRQIVTPILSKMGFSPSIFLIDDSFKSSKVYSPIGSYFDKLKIIGNDLKHQIRIGEQEYTLTKFQTDLWNSIDDSRVIGVSAPTSAGKSYLLYLKIIDLILKGCSRFVYIVPTLSLVGQVTTDISNLLKQFDIAELQVLNSFEDLTDRFIYVVTQERALAIFSDEDLNEIDLLIVDEIQNIERVANEGPDRSKILYDVLKDVKNDYIVDRIILSGPRLKNVGNLGFDIFGEVSNEKVSESPPVLSITYSISSKAKHFYLSQYSVAFDQPIQTRIENDDLIYGLGLSQYNEKFQSYINSIISSLTDSVNIIFSPTVSQARKSAKSYYDEYASINRSREMNENESLVEYIKQTVHPYYDLAKYLSVGIAYHTGRTPSNVRKTLELASVEGLVKNIFCTTTLMQGVNLPANNVIIRNPNLFTRRKKDDENVRLSAYEFANLRGRAGRLLIDFIGRTVVLDEGSFIEDYDIDAQTSLFEDEQKEIQTGYRDVYFENEKDIKESLIHDERVIDESYKYLLTHIRYTLYKYGLNGEERLKDVGISIDSKTISNTLKDLNSIKTPRELILKNRYWDPLDLDHLYSVSGNPFPKTVWESQLASQLFHWLLFMQYEFPYYFRRYINIYNQKYLLAIALTAENWAREVPLGQILIRRFGTEEYEGIDEDIDSEIEKINKRVVFGLPMLFKPLADINGETNSLIMSLEYGVHSKVAKYLIDRGVPRETAILVSSFQQVDESEDIGKQLNWDAIKKKVSYWEGRHLEHLW